MIVPENQI
jgi:C1A family cysteine protease